MDTNYNVIIKWFENQCKKKYWSDYLASYGYEKIAIYGAGELGRYLGMDLAGSTVEVVCYIDRNAERLGSVNETPVVTMDGFFQYDFSAEAIIVSVISADREVLLDVLDRDVSMPVLSLRDMVYEM